jgi:hypothetical protein
MQSNCLALRLLLQRSKQKQEGRRSSAPFLNLNYPSENEGDLTRSLQGHTLT